MDAATETDTNRPPSRWRVILPLIALVAGFAAIRWYLAGHALLSGDEAYYWLWSRHPQLSYYDHPPMAAWWMTVTTWLLGTSEAAIRLPSIAAAAVVTLLVHDTTRRAFDSAAAGLMAATWLNVTLLFGASAVIATPDAPLLVFWSLALWAMVRLLREGQARWLYLLAVSVGLGFTGKYTMVLIGPGLLAAFLLFRQGRRWLVRPDLYVAGLVAVACTAPVLAWNYRHDWISLRKQFSHAFDSPVADPLASLGAFVGAQAGLITPLIFGFCLWGLGWSLWAGWRRRRPDWFVLGATSATVLAFFTQHAWGGLVQAHWAGPAWLGAIIATTGAWTVACGRTPRRPGDGRLIPGLYIAAPLVAAAAMGAVYLQMATAALPIPPRIDPIARLGGWDRLAEAVERHRRDHPDRFVFVQKHEISGLLTYYLPDHPRIFLTGSAGRPRIPSYGREDVAELAGRDGVLVSRAGRTAVVEISRHCNRLTPLETVDRPWGDRIADRYELWLCESYRPGLFGDQESAP